MSRDYFRYSPISNEALDELEALDLLRSEVPGTLPGLGSSILASAGAPLPSGALPAGGGRDIAESAAESRAANDRIAAVDAQVRRARELVPDAARRRSVTERTEIPLPFTDRTVSYNPFALSTSIPGAPSMLAAIGEAGERLGLTPDRPFSEREAEWQGMQDVAEMDDPTTAAVGRLASLAVSAPFLAASAPASITRAGSVAEALGTLGAAARVPAAVGGAAGVASGTLRSEGQSGLDRASTIVGSGLRGVGAGGTASVLSNLGGAARLLGAARSGIPGAALTFGGGAAEGAGFGALGRAMETRGNLSEPGYLSEVLTPTAADVGIGGLGALGSRWMTRQAPRVRTDATDLDPTADAEREIIAEMGIDAPSDLPTVDLPEYRRPERTGTILSDAFGENPLADMASEARLGAGGVINVRQRRQALQAFDSLEDAANAMRESGISPRQSLRGVPGNVRHAAAVRDAAAGHLNSLYNEATRRGAVVPGNVMSDYIDAQVARRYSPSAGDEATAALEQLSRRGDDLRYGRQTPERAEYESALARYEDLPVEDIGAVPLVDGMDDVPGLVAMTPRMTARSEVAPRLVPIRETIRNLNLSRDVSGDRAFSVGAPRLPEALQRIERTANTIGRNEAFRRALPERVAERERASRDFRIGNIVTPYNAPAAADAAAAGNLSAELQLAVNGIPAFLGRNALAPHMSAIRATLAEGGLRGLGESVADVADLGSRYAERLSLSPRTMEALRSVGRGSGRGATMAEQRSALRAVADALPLGPERSAFDLGARRAGYGVAAQAAPGLIAADVAAQRSGVDPELRRRLELDEADARRAQEIADSDAANADAQNELMRLIGIPTEGPSPNQTQDEIDAQEADSLAAEELRRIYGYQE